LALFGNKRDEGDNHDTTPGRSEVEAPPVQRTAVPQTAQPGGNSVANIGKSISIKGDLTGNEDMVIEGKVEGKVDLPNNELTVGANGEVKAELNATAVVIVGRVIGNVVGIDRVEIQSTGRVEGNVTAPKLTVAEGAQLDGAIQMSGTASAASSTSAPATPAAKPQNPDSEVRKVG
jgi:cytoskeletal protein CcmA (bactofilin family)